MDKMYLIKVWMLETIAREGESWDMGRLRWGSRDIRCHPMDSAKTKTRAVLEKIASDRYKSLALEHMVSMAHIPAA